MIRCTPRYLNRALHETLIDLCQQFYSSDLPSHLMRQVDQINRVFQDLIEQDKLNIRCSAEVMKQTFERYGVIPLRPLTHPSLMLFCGNYPVYSSFITLDERKPSSLGLG